MTTGSFYNNLYGNAIEGRPEPEPGMGATRLMWTDRIACTVTEVVRRDKAGRPTMVTVQEDRAIRTDQRGMSDHQDYRYEIDPEGALLRFSLRSNDCWVRVGDSTRTGERLLIGIRRHYYDVTF